MVAVCVHRADPPNGARDGTAQTVGRPASRICGEPNLQEWIYTGASSNRSRKWISGLPITPAAWLSFHSSLELK